MRTLQQVQALVFHPQHILDLWGGRALRYSNFSEISDAALDNLVRQILTSAPQSGIGLIRGALQSRGWRINRHRIMAALQRLEPVMSALRQTRRIIRRTYNVPSPNSLW